MQQILLGLGGAAGINVDDVFAVTTYTGNGGSSRSINNGLDLDGEGGIVWIKSRNLTNNHVLHSTDFVTDVLSVSPNTTNPYDNHGGVLTGYNNNGWTMGNNSLVNGFNDTYVAWSFLKAAKFFDVVTYTGNSTAGRTISHNLDAVPGAIWVKELTVGDSWACYHKATGNTKAYFLNTDGTGTTNGTPWNNTTPTSTEFTVGSDAQVNGSSRSYVAFLFAEDTENLIKCGDYAGNGTLNNGPTVTLGFEPQWIIIKAAESSGQNWNIGDSARGFTSSVGSTDGKELRANTTGSENTRRTLVTTSTGFQIMDSSNELNESQKDYFYIAIAAS